MAGTGRNDPCPCGSGRKYKKCCLETDRAFANAPALKLGRGETLLVIENEGRVLARKIPRATPLPKAVRQGLAAEVAAHDAAAVWGLPDFVCRADRRRLGSGVRELGDGLLVLGELAVVLQVKSREAQCGDAEKERRWIEKQVHTAVRQANGTIRQIEMAPTRVTNDRGRAFDLSPNEKRWLICVIIDHPAIPDGIQPDLSQANRPAIALSRRDWEFLFSQLKSTYAVAQYIERVADDSDYELDHESGRYTELALADLKAEPGPIDHVLLGPSARPISVPMLPLDAQRNDRDEHSMIRWILEDIATAPLGDTTEANRIRALGELDRLPVAHRSGIGAFLLQSLRDVQVVADDEVAWRFRSLRSSHTHLGFAACSKFSAETQMAFGAWVELRHYDMCAALRRDELLTVGVLLTPRHDGRRGWDTSVAAITGPVEYEADDLASLRKFWPSLATDPLRTAA